MERFFELRNELLEFLKSENQKTSLQEFINILENSDFLQQLGFLTDITAILNHLNLNLQGKNKIIIEIIFVLDSFKNKLKSILSNLENKNIASLKSINTVYEETKCDIKFDYYKEKIR